PAHAPLAQSSFVPHGSPDAPARSPGRQMLGPGWSAVVTHAKSQLAPAMQSPAVLHEEHTPASPGPALQMPEAHSSSVMHCSASSFAPIGTQTSGTNSSGDTGSPSPHVSPASQPFVASQPAHARWNTLS